MKKEKQNVCISVEPAAVQMQNPSDVTEGSSMNDHYYLFHAGRDVRAYDLLGAHIEYRSGKSGVVFRVWAPEAREVYVTGDFAAWKKCAVLMEKKSVGVWETYIEGLGEYDAYKYNVITRDGALLEKTDPYGFHSELRPGTASKVYDMTKYRWQDAEWMERRDKINHYAGPLNIYEVHLGSWKRGEENAYYTYRRFADELIPYVKEMGYTHIELLPVMEHPLDMSWGYQCMGYFCPTSRFGEPRDLMELIDRCHQAGIGVILDWVPAHFPKDASGLYEFDGTPIYEGNDVLQREHPSWGTRIFDYGRNEVRSFLMSSAIFWLDNYHADGFRVDAVASMIYRSFCREEGQWTPNQYGGSEHLEAIAFMKELNHMVFEKYPNVLMMAEESSSWPMVTKPTYMGGLGFNYKWNLGWMNDVLEYMKVDPVYRKYKHNLITFSMTYAFSENYVLPLSHDEVVHLKNSLIGRQPGDYWKKFAGLRLLLAYQMAHPGKKLLFMGGEFGQFAEWAFDRSLDWHLLDYEMHRNLHRYTKDLNHFYLDNAPLWENDADWSGFQWISCENADDNILVMRRIDRKGEDLIVILNFSPVVRHGYRIGLPFDGMYREVFTSDDLRYGGSGCTNDAVHADPIPWNGQPFSAPFTIPPLAASFICREKAVSEDIPVVLADEETVVNRQADEK